MRIPKPKYGWKDWFTGMKNRYWNCRYWYGSKRHSALNAFFRPSHANANLRDPW